jgi:hypothetical protein
MISRGHVVVLILMDFNRNSINRKLIGFHTIIRNRIWTGFSVWNPFASSNAARFRISNQIKLISHTASDFDMTVFIPGFL